MYEYGAWSMRYDIEHKSRTRERVLSQAALSLRTKGRELVIADVMREAGLTHGGFYAHFSSKDDLLAEAIAYQFDRGVEAQFPNGRTGDPAATLDRFIESYCSDRHRLARVRCCLVPVLTGESALLPDTARQRYIACVEDYIAIIAHFVDGLELDASGTVAAAVFSQMAGAIAISRLETDEERASALLAFTRGSVRATLGLPPRRAAWES